MLLRRESKAERRIIALIVSPFQRSLINETTLNRLIYFDCFDRYMPYTVISFSLIFSITSRIPSLNNGRHYKIDNDPYKDPPKKHSDDDEQMLRLHKSLLLGFCSCLSVVDIPVDWLLPSPLDKVHTNHPWFQSMISYF